MLTPRKQLTSVIHNGKIYTIGGNTISTTYGSGTLEIFEILEIGDSFTEEIIPIEEDLSFDTYNHVTYINSLDKIAPTITADFEVEL